MGAPTSTRSRTRRAAQPRRSRRKSPPAIVTDGLTKTFGGTTALRGLSLEVATGEVFGYLGPNGSGKTTTIRLLLDFIRPTHGTASVLGGHPSDPTIRRRVGYCPSELHFDPHYTATDVISHFAALRGGVDMAWAQELTERFALDPTKRFSDLSSGNKRKVAVVQAFMHKPELLLLDEPTAGLDPLLQQEFRDLVRETARGGATVFLSSHLLHEVEHLATRVGILREGLLVKVASLDELRRRARQRIDLHLDTKASAEPFERLPEVVAASASNRTVHLEVEGPVARVLRVASELPVLRIDSSEADLEETFLDLYREDVW